MKYSFRSLVRLFEDAFATKRSRRTPDFRLSVTELEDRCVPAITAPSPAVGLPIHPHMVTVANHLVASPLDNSIKIADGTSVTVHTTLNPDGTVASQVITYFNADNTVNTTVSITDTLAGDKSLSMAQALVAAGNGSPV